MRSAIALWAVISVAAAVLGATAISAQAADEDVTGRFQLIHGDAVDKSIYVPFINARGALYRLQGAGDLDFQTGQQITVSGTVRGHDIVVSRARATGPAPALRSVAAAPRSLNVLVELVSWTSPDSVTTAQAQAQYATTNNTWYTNDSYRSMSVSSSATSWLTIPAPEDPDGTGPNTPCDNIGTIQAEGDQAASAAGYDPSAFTNVVYYYPTCPGEQWGGWGQQPGDRTWLIGEMDTRVSVHELGHNLGLGHSHSETCTSGTATVAYSDTCTMSEYGDPTSAMGAGYTGQGMYAASQQVYLGWLGVGAHAVQTVTSSGSYALTPVEAQAGGTQALRVSDSSGMTFWIEYRQAAGNDSFLPAGNRDGVLIRTGDNETNLYDMRPATPGTFTDAALPAGSSWTNSLGDLRVSVGTATASAVNVTVTLGAASYPLSITKSGGGAGTITSVPAGINCGSVCSATYANSTSVTLTATPTSGSAFAGWGGACSGAISTCTVSMTAARAVTASFSTTGSGTRYEESAVSLDDWVTSQDPSGTFRVSRVAGSTAQFTFTGPAVQWLTKKAPGHGKASVTIDGVSKGTFDLYATALQSYTVPFTGLTSSSHKLVIKVLSSKNAASTDFKVAVDGFTVGTTTSQENAGTVLYNTWKAATSTAASGGVYRLASTTGHSATFSFTGSSVDWITFTGPGWGIAQVFIDGVDKGIVDLYATTARPQAAKTYSGLTAGAHTVQVKVLGTKNAAASSSNVAIDAFVIR